MPHHAPRPSNALRAFTIIELLVVISIISALASLLMPSLRQARIVATRTVTSSNNRQLIAGFTAYSVDHNGYPPHRVLAPWNDWTSFAAGPSTSPEDRVIYDTAVAYGFMDVTAHPSVGSPPWDHCFLGGNDPGQPSQPDAPYAGTWSGGKWVWFNGYASPWALCFNYTQGAYGGYDWSAYSAPWVDKIQILEQAKPENPMVGDMMNTRWRGGDPTSADYYYNHSISQRSPKYLNNYWPTDRMQFNPCDLSYNGTLEDVAGGFMGKYDGSVQWYGVPAPADPNVIMPAPSDTWVWKWTWENIGCAAPGDF